MSGGPTGCQGSETLSKIGPTANATAGSAIPIVNSAPAPCAVPVMNRRRVTVSPSKAPGIPRSAVYLDLCLSCLLAKGSKQYRLRLERSPAAARSRSLCASGALCPRGRAHRRQRARLARAGERLRAPIWLAGAPADRACAGRPRRRRERLAARSVSQCGQRDHVRQLGHRLQVAERDKPREAERVELIAREQPEIGFRWVQQARSAVVQQIALVDRLQQQLVLRRPRARARSRRRQLRRPRVARLRRALLRTREQAREQPVLCRE